MTKTKSRPRNREDRAEQTSRTHALPVDDQGFVCLQGELLWKYRALDSEYRSACVGVTQKDAELAVELAKPEHQIIRQLHSDRIALKIEAARKGESLSEFNRDVEKKMGVSLQACSIDDETGRIYILQDGAQKPISGKTRGARRRTK